MFPNSLRWFRGFCDGTESQQKMNAVNYDKTHIYHTENVTDEEVLPPRKNLSLDQIPVIVRNIQHNLLYYLKNEDDHDISRQSEQESTIRYDDMGVTEPGNDDETHFTIRIPSNHVQLKVLKKKIASQSQVFEAMLKSEMVESKRNEMTFEGSNPEAFQQVIHFIHCGSLGVPKPKYQNVKQAITLEQLIALLEIADEYQVMTLIQTIAQAINEYTASILAVKSLDLSEDTQKIILKAASAIIAKKFECLMADLIYNDEWDSCIPKYPADDPPSHAELVKEIAEHVPYLKNVHPKFLGPFTMLLTTHAKLFTRLPYHFFKLILQNSNWDYDSNITLHMIFLWIIHDREGRFLDGLSILRSNYFDLTDCDVENIYHVVYQALLNVCQLPEFSKECSEFKEFVTMALFRINDTIPDEDWNNLLPNKEEKEVRNIKACMFGLDACGKTTILSNMMSRELDSVTPTRGYNVGTFILDVAKNTLNITLVGT